MASPHRITITRLDVDEIVDDPKTIEAMRPVAASIAKASNVQTTAPIGITYEVFDDRIMIGPTGAAALPLEVGTRAIPARRYMKRALDQHERPAT